MSEIKKMTDETADNKDQLHFCWFLLHNFFGIMTSTIS